MTPAGSCVRGGSGEIWKPAPGVKIAVKIAVKIRADALLEAGEAWPEHAGLLPLWELLDS